LIAIAIWAWLAIITCLGTSSLLEAFNASASHLECVGQLDDGARLEGG
jgi:hypothetical protein